jgi:hypothetical protein
MTDAEIKLLTIKIGLLESNLSIQKQIMGIIQVNAKATMQLIDKKIDNSYNIQLDKEEYSVIVKFLRGLEQCDLTYFAGWLQECYITQQINNDLLNKL